MMLAVVQDFNSQAATQAPPTFRSTLSRLAAVGIFVVVFAIIFLHVFGLIIGLVVGIAYVVAAAVASAHYPLDLHDGVVLEDSRAPESIHYTEAISQELGIEPPPIYSLNLDKPQMCVCAAGMGRRVRARIGVSKSLLQEADNDQLHALLTLAMARISTGEATVASIAAALAGLPLQMAQAPWINGSEESSIRDVDSGLSPVGKGLLIIFSPFARLMLTLAKTDHGIFRSDAAAVRIGRGRVTVGQIESSLKWLVSLQTPIVRDPVAEYNPAEACLYLISPFEYDFINPQQNDDMPLWKRCRFLVTSTVPYIETRMARIRALVEEDDSEPTEVVFPVISDESV